VSEVVRPSNRSYRLRGDRATGAQSAAYQELWPLYGLAPHGVIDPAAIFPKSTTRALEIGSGMGEATAQIAAAFPETGFLVVEVHKPGLGSLMNLCHKAGIENVRVIEEDAHLILRDSIPDETLDAIHLYFPDPWPKNGHQKRRIIQAEFLELIHPKIKDGGHIHIATDWLPYAQWIERIFGASHLFSGGVIQRPQWRPVSKFEGQGLRKGHFVTDLKYFKK
jgi:tRNA (guanine-N7-)-methyltransferase